MGLIGSASRPLDNSEEPEVVINDLIRDTDESLVGLRRETVNAVARQQQLEERVTTAGEIADELEEEAALALEHGNEPLARRILDERLDALKARASLREELKSATTLAQQLKSHLVRMEEQAAAAYRRRTANP
jgi:phage shock protein A